MLKISGTKISLTRGDSAYITLTPTLADGSKYELQEGDKIRCQVRDQANDGELLFEGTVTQIRDDMVWHIQPIDTEEAEVKEYVWDAQLELSNGDIFTFIPESKFKLLNEVTMGGDNG